MEIVKIQQRPQSVNIEGINIEKGECISNALNVSKANGGVLMVEGILQLVGKDKTRTALPHMWNALNGSYFDVTSGVWPDRPEDEEIESKIYIKLSDFAYDEQAAKGGIAFDRATEMAAEVYGEILDCPFKFDQVVILLDPVSKKPVNIATVKFYDKVAKMYKVNIHRVNNEIEMDWREDLLNASTPALIEEVETRLSKTELITDLIVTDHLKNKHITGPVLEIPLSVPNYIVYYTQMNINSQQKWRLLTFNDCTPNTQKK